MTRLGALLLFAVACSSTSVSVDDVASAAGDDLAALGFRLPSEKDVRTAAAVTAPAVMKRTETAAGTYLEESRNRYPTDDDYVRALLACSYLAQDRNREAFALTRTLRLEGEPTDPVQKHKWGVITCTVHAVDVCLGLDAREAVDELIEGRLEPEEFIRLHGSAAGIRMPASGSPNYAKFMKLEANRLRTYCFAGTVPPERVEFHRGELRRLIAEQVFNDSSSLVVSLPSPAPRGHGAIDRWLARVAVASILIHRYLMQDLLPVELDPKQKEWQREQTHSVFNRAREAAGRFLSPEAITRVKKSGKGATTDERLYARLDRAEEAVIGWITVR